MYNISGCNGGCYNDIRWECPCDPQMNVVLKDLEKSGMKFRVYYVEYEYEGYSGNVELIDDETLDTIYVFHKICWNHSGESYWYIDTIDDDFNHTTVYNSRLQ